MEGDFRKKLAGFVASMEKEADDAEARAIDSSVVRNYRHFIDPAKVEFPPLQVYMKTRQNNEDEACVGIAVGDNRHPIYASPFMPRKEATDHLEELRKSLMDGNYGVEISSTGGIGLIVAGMMIKSKGG